MKKDLIKHYFRISLGILVFSAGIGFLVYGGDSVKETWKWYNYLMYIWNYIWITGFGLWLLDVDYSLNK